MSFQLEGALRGRLAFQRMSRRYEWALIWHCLSSQGAFIPLSQWSTWISVTEALMEHKLVLPHHSELSKSGFHRKWARHAVMARRMPTVWSGEYTYRVYRMTDPFMKETAFRLLSAMWQITRVIHSSFCNTDSCWSLGKLNDCSRHLSTFRRQKMSYQGSLVHAGHSLESGTALQHTESDFETPATEKCQYHLSQLPVSGLFLFDQSDIDIYTTHARI